MRITFYGTAAAEGIPALYCSCEVCREARRLGGKEIRSRHLSTVDEDIQFDLGPDVFYHIHSLGLDLLKIRHLAITHHHSDHFTPGVLATRIHPYALALEHPLQLIASPRVHRQLRENLWDDAEGYRIHTVEAKAYVPVTLDEQTTLTPLPAHHALDQDAFIYLLERGNKKLLYAHDTGPLFPEVVSYLEDRQLDAISMDCTGVYLGAGSQHMDLVSCEQTARALLQNGALKQESTIIINHFSHGGGANHWQIEREAQARGWLATYDGMKVDF